MISLLLVGVFSYLIAHCFVSVFEMTVDTVFICYCEDYEENNGSTKPYFMSPKLMKVMRKLNGNSYDKYEGNYNQPYPEQQNLQPYPMDQTQYPQSHDTYNFNAQNTYPFQDPIQQPFISQPVNDFAQIPYPQHPSAYESTHQNQYNPQNDVHMMPEYAEQNQYPPQNQYLPQMPNYSDNQQPIGFNPPQFDQPVFPTYNYGDSSLPYPPQSYQPVQQGPNPPQIIYPPQAPYNSYT